MTFIFLVGAFMSFWLGASILGLEEWFIKRMPFMRYSYNASKKIYAAISPGVLFSLFLMFSLNGLCMNDIHISCLFVDSDQNTQALKEVAMIRHPCIGEYSISTVCTICVGMVDLLTRDEFKYRILK